MPVLFFYMNYDNDIIQVLREAGCKGLSVRKIAMHVFNANNGFFEAPDFEEVVRCVYSFLLRNSKSRDSIIEHTGKKGIYRLNMKSQRTCQLMLQFEEETPPEPLSPPSPDTSLSLFD